MNEFFEDNIGLSDEHLTMRFVLMILCLGSASISFIVAIVQVQQNIQILQLALGFLFLIFGTAGAVGVLRTVLIDRNNVQLVQNYVISLNEDEVEWK